MRRPHDAFLKLLYRAGARDAITLFFPDLAAHIRWEDLHWIEKEIVIPGEAPRSLVADLVALTRDVEGRYLQVLIHPEIQMRPPPDMGWRMTQYNTGLLLQQGDPQTRVLSFVFYHCRGVGGIRKERYRLDFYGEPIHETGYWSVGLGDLDAETYAERNNPIAWALAAWMRQKRQGRVQLRLRLLDRILRFVQDERYRRLLLDAVRTYFSLTQRELAEEQRLLQSQEYGEVNRMLRTELGRLEERARREGEERARRQMQTELTQLEERARREGEERARRQMQTELTQLEERARREGEERARRQMQTELTQLEERARREGEERARRQMQTELTQLEERARREGEERARRQMQTELTQLEERARREGEERARRQMQTELTQLEERARREGEVEALRQALGQVIEARFPTAAAKLTAQVRQLEDPERLKQILPRVVVAASLEEIRGLLEA